MKASVVLCVLMLLAPLAAPAETWRPATLVQAEMREMQSRHTGRHYRLYLSKPQGEAPPQGYPVVYVLDANLFFPLLAQQALMYQPHATRDGREAVLVVGIGYPGDGPFDIPARAEDYTPPAPGMRDTGDQPAARHGGAERFLDFLEEEVKPLVAARYKVDAQRQTLFGHSYGGLFTVYTLLARPQAFQSYFAASPSLWWNRRQLFDQLQGFSLPAGAAARLLLSVGAAEQPEPGAPLADERQRQLAQRRMVDNARELQQAMAARGVFSELRLQPGGDHAGNAFFSAVQVLDFALQRPAGR